MSRPRILLVDDDPNIRFALGQALEPLGAEVRSAANGREALEALEAGGTALVLLDLRMPELGGMELLRRLPEVSPESRVIVVTAHGSVPGAVEATRLGAVDFIEKPFSATEIRSLVQRVLDRTHMDPERAAGYDAHLELARRFFGERRFRAARAHVEMAIDADHDRPDAFNLLGVLEEIAGHRDEALKQYRVALDLDPTHPLARQNLSRAHRGGAHQAAQRPHAGPKLRRSRQRRAAAGPDQPDPDA